MNSNESSNQAVMPDVSHSTGYAPNPRSDDLPPSNPPVGVVSEKRPGVAPGSGPSGTTAPADPPTKSTMESVKVLFGRWAKKAAESTKKGQDYAGDLWQHLKTGGNIGDAAVGRIAQGTKVIAEGGYERIFTTTFQTIPEEQLVKSYACYLSTSAGPVMGLLYISTEKLAFCSDNPLPYKVGDEKKWSYYKVVVPLVQVKEVRPSRSKANPPEKYIQVISVDNHEFWFMGFVYYDSALKYLQPLGLATSNS